MPSASNSDDDMEPTFVGNIFIFISGIVALSIALLVWMKWDIKSKKRQHGRSESSEGSSQDEMERATAKLAQKGQPKSGRRKPERFRATQFEHSWLLTTLKGHVSDVIGMDFASNGKFVVSIGTDRSIYLWHVKDFGEREHKLHRSVLELDSATHVAFAPDSKSILLSLHIANKLAVHKLTKKEGSQTYKFVEVESVDFPPIHARDINGIGMACNGKYAMSSSEDNIIVVYSIHGEVLKIVELKLNMLYKAVVSPCGRFIAASGFTPDVFIFEVLFDRQGNFQDVKRAFELKGHSSGIYSFAFDQDSSKCVTASKDGTWKIFNTNVRYAQGEEAKVIASGEWDVLKNADPQSVHVAVSPSGRSFALTASRHLRLYSASKPSKEFNIVLDVHDKPVSCLRMSSCGKMLATGGDRYIRVFHNVAEYFSDVVVLEEAFKEAREETKKRRLQEQLDEAKKLLSSFSF